MNTGNAIRAKRISMGITAKEAAAMLEIPYTTYCNYENGNREPRLSALRKIASCFNVPLSSLTDFGKFSTDELHEDFSNSDLVSLYYKLNMAGRAEALKRLEEMTQLPQYTQSK